jgi:outer membrane protein TolC
MSVVQAGQRAWIGCFLVPVLGWFLCTGPAAQAQSKPPARGESDQAAEIKKLLKERRDALQEVVKLLMAQYRAGAAGFVGLAQAERDLLKATLDLSDDPKERRAALEEFQKIAVEIVRLTEALVRVGGTTRVDVLQARTVVLEVRIELLREELKTKPRK